MAVTFSSLQTKLDRFADDELTTDASGDAEERRFTLPSRIDSWNWAQRYFVHHTPRQRSCTLEIDTDGRSAVLPDDFFEVYGIYDSYEETWWHRTSFKPGDYRALDDDTLEYWVWDGAIILETDEDHGTDDLTLYYWAYWPDVEFSVGDTDEDITYEQESVYTPKWAELALVHLCIAWCWQPMAITANDINEWRIRVDSGTPMHNPRQAAAWDHYKWYNAILGHVPEARG